MPSKERFVKGLRQSTIQSRVSDLKPKVAQLNQVVEILKASQEIEEAKGFD